MELVLEQLYFLIDKIAIFLIIILATAIIAKLAKRMLGRMLKDSMPHLASSIQQYTCWFIWLTGLMVAISQLGLMIDVLLLILALLGIGFITATRDALLSIAARSFLDVYSQYKVGDWISIGNYYGKVIEINAINTLLVQDDQLIAIPNSLFLKDVMINKSRGGLETTIHILIDKKIDAVEFEEKLMKSFEGINKYLKANTTPVLATVKSTDNTNELALMLVLKDPEQKGVVQSEVNDRVKKIVDELLQKKEAEAKEREEEKVEKLKAAVAENKDKG